MEALANTEQEIHVEIKVRSSNLTWILSAIYASPRSEERRRTLVIRVRIEALKGRGEVK